MEIFKIHHSPGHTDTQMLDIRGLTGRSEISSFGGFW